MSTRHRRAVVLVTGEWHRGCHMSNEIVTLTPKKNLDQQNLYIKHIIRNHKQNPTAAPCDQPGAKSLTLSPVATPLFYLSGPPESLY